MKPLKIISSKFTTLAMLIILLLVTVACGSNSGNPANNSEQARVETKKVPPPSMDIHTATIMGDLEVIQQHIKAGSDLDVREPSMGSSPLISAAVFGKTDISRELIKAGADVNITGKHGWTPLHIVLRSDSIQKDSVREQIVLLMLEYNADVSANNKNWRKWESEHDSSPFGRDKSLPNNGGTPLEIAISNGFEDIAKLLSEHNRVN